MATGYTIGQIARAADVPTTTIRYYERRGLLGAAGRAGAGRYRVYGDEELARLRFIRAAQATGFSLEDVATLLTLRDGGTDPCRDVQELIEDRLAMVGERLRDLRHVEQVLKASLRLCRQFERTGRCEVIDTLASDRHSRKTTRNSRKTARRG